MVVKSDGEVLGSKVYRGENAVGTFLSDILQEEVAIRESLATPKSIVMTAEDWQKHKNATECHICDKSLIKDRFLDSIPVFDQLTQVVIAAKATKVVITLHTNKWNLLGPKENEKKETK